MKGKIALTAFLILLFSTGSAYAISVFFHGTASGTSVHPLFLLLVLSLSSAVAFKAWTDRKIMVSLFLHKGVIVFLPIFSFLLWISLKSPEGLSGDPSIWMTIFFYIVIYILLAIYTAGLLSLFTLISVTAKHTPVSKWKILMYALLPIAFWSIYLVAYYPATMTPDSLAHWGQIHTLDFSNWHPVIYTWFILALTSIWHSPAIVAIAHIIIMAIIAGYGAYSVEKKGVPSIWVTGGMVLFAIYPLTGVFTIAIWKDVFYSGLLLLWTIQLFQIVSTRGEWLKSNARIIFLSGTALAIALMRSNGLPIFVVIGLFLLVMYRTYLWRMLISLGSVIILYLLITGPFYSYMDVEPGDPNEALSIPTQQFAHIVSEDGDLTSEQAEYLSEIMPLDKWEELYNPYLTDPIKFSAPYDSEVIFEDFGLYLSRWAGIVGQNFGLAVEAYMDQTSVLWQMNQPEDGYTSTYANNIYLYNDYDLKRDPLHDGTYEFVQGELANLNENWLEPFLRPAFYTALILIMGAALTIKSGGRFALILLPVLLNTGTMLLAAPAQDFRYQYSNVLITFLMAGYVFIKFTNTTERKE
ncbi:DUF6020 family protein [Salimicrobium flavidum]|uniref:Dolichyl-phosphate-mannose-protein mannosyltransferase n=1 Tax=Salimicrobium flavidum TaxID=570947 RepID=A0A1N7IZ44_9BACI|nr:DUF6020 family protein [Salimicrobium flavidum]SIS42368.1 hypothetical protein SAMN05421687_10328 [Salimicrobium flavidum]